MAKKIDMFQADKKMAERVTDFMTKKVWGITLKARLRRDIVQLEQSIEGLNNCRGSIIGKDVDTVIAEKYAEIDAKKAAINQQIRDEAHFAYLPIDEEFYKTYKKEDAKNAVAVWCAEWGLETEGTDLERELVEAISGARKLGARAIVRSEATRFTDDKRTKGDVMNILYGRLAEKMLQKGTLKATAIPEDVREAYAPKKRAK